MTQKTEQVLAIVVFDIDGVVRDVSGSYRLALADTVEHFTSGAYRPTPIEIDALKTEGCWNNDWEASQELIYRYFTAQGQDRTQVKLDYAAIVAFFQSRYRGPNSDHWTGYICHEPLLMESSYLDALTQAQIAWGFFSGATRGSADYVLKKRLGLEAPILIAMEDAPGKPDPTGLQLTVEQIEQRDRITTSVPVIYVGDTVADLQTVQQIKQLKPERQWIGVGVLPPHVQQSSDYAQSYASNLQQREAKIVLSHVKQLDAQTIRQILAK